MRAKSIAILQITIVNKVNRRHIFLRERFSVFFLVLVVVLVLVLGSYCTIYQQSLIFEDDDEYEYDYEQELQVIYPLLQKWLGQYQFVIAKP